MIHVSQLLVLLFRMDALSNVTGISAVAIPEQKVVDGQTFPLVLTPSADGKSRDIESWCQWVRDNVPVLREALLKYGAVLFRGFPIKEAAEFDAFVKSFGYEAFPYVGGAAPRKVVVGDVFTANEAPPSELIPYHHEMAQSPSFPKVLFFNCDVAPPNGGETPLVLSNATYRTMQEKESSFVERLEKEGVCYTRVLPDGDDPLSPIGRGWQSTYLTDDKETAEAKARAQGTKFEWLPNGCMKTTTKVLPGVRVDGRTGKKTWFNSIIAAYLGWKDSRNDPTKAVTFPNGEPMSVEVMKTLEKVLDDLSVRCKWEKGDVMMVDNRQALHARRSFVPPRRILACLCEDV